MLKFNDYLKEAALSAKQKKIAAIAGDKDKIDAADLAALRNGKKPVEEASCSGNMKKEELVGNQHKLDKNKNGKLDAHDFKLLRKEEAEQIDELSKKTLGSYAQKAQRDSNERKDDWNHDDGEPYEDDDDNETEKGADARKIHNRDTGVKRAVKKLAKEEIELDEGRMKDLDYDLKNMGHDEFHKQYGKPKSHYDPTNFKKPVEPGKGMDRARALAQRGMQSLSKEEVERIEEKLAQINELSKNTLGSYVKRSANQAIIKSLANPKDDSDDMKTIAKREKGINLATSKLAKEEVEQIDELSKKTLGSYVKKASGDLASSIHYERDAEENDDPEAAGVYAQRAGNRISGLQRAGKKIAKEEVEQEMSPYLKATLQVMDEGKIDNLRDAQKLRRDTQSAYEKDYKPDTSHPHIQVVKGSAYGGANQKDDEGDEKPDETKEKKGRGRPTGSKSGARQKGGGHEDGGIPVHNLNLPKSYK